MTFLTITESTSERKIRGFGSPVFRSSFCSVSCLVSYRADSQRTGGQRERVYRHVPLSNGNDGASGNQVREMIARLSTRMRVACECSGTSVDFRRTHFATADYALRCSANCSAERCTMCAIVCSTYAINIRDDYQSNPYRVRGTRPSVQYGRRHLIIFAIRCNNSRSVR